MSKDLFQRIIHSSFAPLLHVSDTMTFTNTEVKAVLAEKRIEVIDKTSKRTQIDIPTIFFGEHCSFFDPLLLFPVIPFATTKIVGVYIITLLFPFLKKHIIPVSSQNLISGGGWLAPFMWFYSKVEGLTVDQAKMMNRQVVPLSVEVLAKDNCLLIFPDGGIRKDKWFKGIGWILIEFFEEFPKRQMLLHPFYLHNVSTFQIFKQNWSLFIKNKKKYQVSVTDRTPLVVSYDFFVEQGLDISLDKKQQVNWVVQWLYDYYYQQLN